MNRFKCPACGRNQYTSADTAEGCIYCGNKELKKMEILEPKEGEGMREIKFRGKRIDNGEWVYGDLNMYENGVFISNWIGEAYQYEVHQETVGQFTGVKERYPQMVGEGQEIYFGDVVRLFGGEYCQGYYEHDQTIVVKSAYDIVAMEESENVQLLGNVWDNPELLEEGSV